jgi:seryl-tRNA synthetase
MVVKRVSKETLLQEEVAALKTKVRKLQAENRKLRADLVKEISRRMPNVNEPLVPVEEETETTTVAEQSAATQGDN